MLMTNSMVVDVLDVVKKGLPPADIPYGSVYISMCEVLL